MLPNRSTFPAHLAQSICHQVKAAIWGDERDRPVVLKTRKAYALMEFDVL